MNEMYRRIKAYACVFRRQGYGHFGNCTPTLFLSSPSHWLWSCSACTLSVSHHDVLLWMLLLEESVCPTHILKDRAMATLGFPCCWHPPRQLQNRQWCPRSACLADIICTSYLLKPSTETWTVSWRKCTYHSGHAPFDSVNWIEKGSFSFCVVSRANN